MASKANTRKADAKNGGGAPPALAATTTSTTPKAVEGHGVPPLPSDVEATDWRRRAELGKLPAGVRVVQAGVALVTGELRLNGEILYAARRADLNFTPGQATTVERVRRALQAMVEATPNADWLPERIRRVTTADAVRAIVDSLGEAITPDGAVSAKE